VSDGKGKLGKGGNYMAGQRTASANKLTESDAATLDFCKKIGNVLSELMPDPDAKRAFSDAYSKVSMTRDAGAGLGGGKLQRDALCTRGKTDRTPLSNRNLRWHPLIVADSVPSYARAIEGIRVEKSFGRKTLIFQVRQENGVVVEFSPSEVHELKSVYCATTNDWLPVKDELKSWSADDWSSNRCAISSIEYCPNDQALEAYASLAVTVASSFFDVVYADAKNAALEQLQAAGTELGSAMPSNLFPLDEDDALSCPLCRKRISQGLEDFRYELRMMTWRPVWGTEKRNEGDDSSMQIMHVSPLTENWIGHNAANVRFGHRWCNIAMTDHSLRETIRFFEYVQGQHS